LDAAGFVTGIQTMYNRGPVLARIHVVSDIEMNDTGHRGINAAFLLYKRAGTATQAVPVCLYSGFTFGSLIVAMPQRHKLRSREN